MEKGEILISTEEARRVEFVISYNGADISASLKDFLLDASYTDASGQLDDLQITLEDSRGLWQNDWMPAEGDTIEAAIKTMNWNASNEMATLDLGTFEVDGIDFSGPPDIIRIKAISLPIGTTVRREKRSKAWEKVKLTTIAADIAAKAGLTLLFEGKHNQVYDRIEQTEQSDLAFLQDIAVKEGLALKISGGSLILFDESEYEAAPTSLDIRRGKDISSYSFSWSTSDAAYTSCKVVYHDAKKGINIQATFTPPNAPEAGPVLIVNESVDSQAEALRLAEKKLREENKNYGKGSLSMPGNTNLATGLTVNVVGWGRFDGKYIIENAKHSLGSGGYKTDIEIRKVLGW
ncbi:late control protein [Paenibacillus sp. CGMCC 1.16610]|uniref:Late control protein n=1 Tax=Paenibacillus anseongense TaxID=2682845 RepID=A0ABW9U0T4_9BACL|nr:late control protein [Paenibacillus anseongense]MBA2943217.1 late control protein [Paenibacillus sp. CGMCC 1.16610]MVQ33714.1 late control protein [Paenibacillus anseongense]